MDSSQPPRRQSHDPTCEEGTRQEGGCETQDHAQDHSQESTGQANDGEDDRREAVGRCEEGRRHEEGHRREAVGCCEEGRRHEEGHRREAGGAAKKGVATKKATAAKRSVAAKKAAQEGAGEAYNGQEDRCAQEHREEGTG